MKLRIAIKSTAVGLALLAVSSQIGLAEPLVYQGSGRGDLSNRGNAADGTSGLVPVGYSDPETQYDPYSDFMGSPRSQGQLQYNYSGPGSQQGMYGGSPYGQQSPNAPFVPTEVSPYSQYSPYLEIVGEGSDYVLGIDDVVTVAVRNQPDFSGRFAVDPNGNIQYNFIGDIRAIGKTKEELKKDIVEKLKEYVRYPEVAVMISEYRSKNVFVFGYVSRPGKYAMKGNKITVKEAIVAAGLPREDAAMKRVYVIRPSDHTQDGVAAKKKVNLKSLIQKGDSAEDFVLQPGDTIVVDQKYFDRFVNGFSRLVGPVFQAAAVYELGFGSNNGKGFLRK